MRLAKFFSAVAVASLATAPVIAAPVAPATKLSLRASTGAKESNELAPAILIGVLAIAAIAGGVVVVADNDDEPDSP